MKPEKNGVGKYRISLAATLLKIGTMLGWIFREDHVHVRIRRFGEDTCWRVLPGYNHSDRGSVELREVSSGRKSNFSVGYELPENVSVTEIQLNRKTGAILIICGGPN